MKYKVQVSAILLKNGKLAKYGEEVDKNLVSGHHMEGGYLKEVSKMGRPRKNTKSEESSKKVPKKDDE